MEPPKILLDRQVPRKPRLLGGVRGTPQMKFPFREAPPSGRGASNHGLKFLMKGLILRGENDSHQERLCYFGQI